MTVVLFTGASVAVVLTNDRAGERAGQAAALSVQYYELDVALLQEELARQELLVKEGSHEPVVATQRRVNDVFSGIKRLESHAAAGHRHAEAVQQLEADLATYHTSVNRFVFALRTGQPLQDHVLDEQAQQLVQHVAQESHYHRDEAAAAFERMRRAQQFGAGVFPVVGAVALLLVGACLRLLAVQRRHLTTLRDQAETSAVTDELTGLANRAGLRAALGAALPAVPPGRLVGLLLLDLDGFKAVNDTFGHELGDDVLKVVAERLRNTVPDSALVARLGGDEFVVLLPDAADQSQVDRLAGDVWRALSSPTIVRSVLLDIGASIGLAVTAGCSDDHEAAASELLRRADIAMYASKSAKRGPVLFSSVLSGDGRLV